MVKAVPGAPFARRLRKWSGGSRYRIRVFSVLGALIIPCTRSHVRGGQ